MAKFKVIDSADEVEVDFVVCALNGPSPFDDNLTSSCHDCGREVMHRPHVPAVVPKICVECLIDRSKGGKA